MVQVLTDMLLCPKMEILFYKLAENVYVTIIGVVLDVKYGMVPVALPVKMMEMLILPHAPPMERLATNAWKTHTEMILENVSVSKIGMVILNVLSIVENEIQNAVGAMGPRQEIALSDS